MSTDTGQATWRLSQAQVLHCSEKALCVFAAHPPQSDSKVLLLLQAQSQPLLREARERERERQRQTGREWEGVGREQQCLSGGKSMAVSIWLFTLPCLSLSSLVSLYQTKYMFRCRIWCARFDCCGLRSFFLSLSQWLALHFTFFSFSLPALGPSPILFPFPSLSLSYSLNTCAHTH